MIKTKAKNLTTWLRHKSASESWSRLALTITSS